jgi:hypothetical protein
MKIPREKGASEEQVLRLRTPAPECQMNAPTYLILRDARKARSSCCQLTRFQVWPPQNMPPNAQPCTRRVFGPFIAMLES